ncbi:hypothetical protein PAL_GLEAN10011065 [Pteropus alecto]|uniref:Uncharacterized protein n=1 Tax=Pteropus alecto TaxID=9402 RepID=L5KVE1_PTEAL|nr:hypothetical protein PAL_GLEAN10011065 [Pteropus alecto]
MRRNAQPLASSEQMDGTQNRKKLQIGKTVLPEVTSNLSKGRGPISLGLAVITTVGLQLPPNTSAALGSRTNADVLLGQCAEAPTLSFVTAHHYQQYSIPKVGFLLSCI